MSHLSRHPGSLHMMGVLKWLGFVVIFVLCLACGGKGAPKRGLTKTFTVHRDTFHKALHFSGIVQPLREYPISSPSDALVEVMHVHYGQPVKKGQVLLTLNSPELQKQYNETLTEYLKAKDSYSVSKAKFNGTEDLWQAGLLSKNNYLSEKSSLNTAHVTVMQATRRLSEMLEKIGDGAQQDLSHLSFAEFDKVRLALTGNHHLIQIKAPGDGVLLYPPKVSEDKTARVTVGSAVKTGQMLALVGDLSGISVEIEIPEVDIDTVKTGMPAIIRGVAFAKQSLQGRVVAVNVQANSGANNSLPSFNAIVEVKALDASQQSIIKVGMSASVELAADSPDQLLVPIAAVTQKNGQNRVRILEPNGKVHEQAVVTGPARADKVVIQSGLHAGDVIVYE